MGKDYDEFDIDAIIEMIRNDTKKANEAEAREREKYQKKEEPKVEPVKLKGEGIFKDREALKRAQEKEDAKKKANSTSTGDPFDELFSVFGVSPEEVDERIKKVEVIPVSEKKEEYDTGIVDVLDFSRTRSSNDIEELRSFFGDAAVKEKTPYERIRENSVGKKDSRKSNKFSVIDVVKKHSRKILLISSVLLVLWGAKSGINVIDSKIDNSVIDHHGIQTLSHFSNFDYGDIFYSGTESLPNHVEAAVDFYDDTIKYNPEYRLLSIYQTYDSYKGNDRLYVMDGFLSDVRALAHKSNSTLQIEISGQRCFLEHALHVIEKGTGKDITKYDKLIDEYLEVRNKYPNDSPYSHLNGYYQGLAQELMEQYREYNDELYVDFIKEIKSGGIRR